MLKYHYQLCKKVVSARLPNASGNCSPRALTTCPVCPSRRGRDPPAGQAVPQAGPGQLGRAVHRRVHVAAGAAAEPAGAARDRHIRRGREWRGETFILIVLTFYSWKV